MEVRALGFGVLEIVPRKFGDARGFFAETWKREAFAAHGISCDFMQDNQSHSADRGVLRGLHAQMAPHAQAKLIRVLKGAIFDVAVDIRPGSATYGKWVSAVLTAEGFNQLYVPAGCAHGFLTLEPGTDVFYKVSAPWVQAAERSIAWNDPAIAIAWPLAPGQQPVLSAKDAAAPPLSALAGETVC